MLLPVPGNSSSTCIVLSLKSIWKHLAVYSEREMYLSFDDPKCCRYVNFSFGLGIYEGTCPNLMWNGDLICHAPLDGGLNSCAK